MEPDLQASEIEDIARFLRGSRSPWPSRLNLEPEKVEQGLAKLVLSLIELIRQLLERQAIRRMEGDSLSPGEIERLGATLMKLEKRMEELKEHFGIDDLNLDLGPLGKLID
ncbi:MAG: gas vesicle protein K [Deltaproteobacteria bacterium]|nr:gas vesicle protein K [Deltaproteobacteria bacterium]